MKQKHLTEAVEAVYDIVSAMDPYDALEREHIKDTLVWISSGVPIFRIAKPDVPNKHLVSYFVMLDADARKVLLVDHKKSGLWLPAGGHIEINENPRDAARRECLEELGVEADFWTDNPFFLTSTVTVGLTAGHTDVSFWYVIKGSQHIEYKFDRGEFNDIKWFGFEEIPWQKTDPHMKRFINKLQDALKPGILHTAKPR